MDTLTRFVIIALLTAGCASLPDAGSPDANAGSEGDASAQVACGKLHDIGRDYKILSGTELRDRILDMNDIAAVSDVAPVRTASRDMAEAITAGQIPRMTEAVYTMNDACGDIGA